MKHYDLTKGPIVRQLLVLSTPLIIINLINMLYNFTDMYWVGKMGTESLSALGTAGLFLWLSASISMLVSTGVQILVSHAIGQKKFRRVSILSKTAIKLIFIISAIYSLSILFFADYYISLFNIGDDLTIMYATNYLRVVSVGIFFNTINNVFGAILNARGLTKTVSKYTVFGVVINLILDPLFIYVFGLGVTGAAIATSLSLGIIFFLFINKFVQETNVFKDFKLFSISRRFGKEIIMISLPTALQNIFFTAVAMMISVQVLIYGVDAIAAQKIGANVESFSWMISIGISTAIAVYVGQNIGANQISRIRSGYIRIFGVMSIYGVLLTLVLIIFPEDIIRIFSDDPSVITIGVSYLRILSIAQLFAIYEGVSTGYFNGVGKTKIPAFFSISGNLLRIILVYVAAHYFSLNAIWIVISLTGVYKGLFLTIICVFDLIKLKPIENY